MKFLHDVSLLLFMLVAGPALSGLGQDSPSESTKDPLEQKLEAIELRGETIFDALARLDQAYDLAISIEGIIPASGVVTNPQFKAKTEDHTIAQALTWLCSLDSRYTWTRDGNMVNLFPRAFQNDPHYLFNRTLSVLEFNEVKESGHAAISVVQQLGDPAEHLYFMGIGGTESFAKPWTATFHDITVRQAMNRIARQLGPSYGWQLGGHTKSRLMMFHYKLGARPGYNLAPEN